MTWRRHRGSVAGAIGARGRRRKCGRHCWMLIRAARQGYCARCGLRKARHTLVSPFRRIRVCAPCWRKALDKLLSGWPERAERLLKMEITEEDLGGPPCES